MDLHIQINRRQCLIQGLGAVAATALPRPVDANASTLSFRLRFVLASAMYGYGDLESILPEVKKTGANAIDIWPKVHGNQREQIEAMGEARFKSLLNEHGIKLGVNTCYRLGPFKLAEEMRFAERVAGQGVVLVTGAHGPKNLNGQELKAGVRRFIEEMKPHVAMSEETGCVIAIENHANSLIESPDSLRWFGEFNRSPHLGIALAPHHLPQDAELIAAIAEDLGPNVKFFYAQQHGMGSSTKLPKEQEMLQMPGRGPLDFAPILGALSKINYDGYTEIFMHPKPRGIPILDTTEAITAEINRSRRYLLACL